MDEELAPAPAENTSVAEASNASAPPADEPTTSGQPDTDGLAEQTQIDEPAAGATETEPERKPSRAERRIRQLAEENRQLRTQPNQLNPSLPQPPDVDIEPGQEISPELYRQHLAQAGQASAAQIADQLRQEFNTKEALRNFDSDLELVETKFPELQEGSDNYIPELEAEIAEEFKAKAYRPVGFDPVSGQTQFAVDPSVRLADIAKRKVDLARAIATKSSAEMKNAVAKQADQTAPKPSAGVKVEKPISEMTSAELEAHMRNQGKFIKA